MVLNHLLLTIIRKRITHWSVYGTEDCLWCFAVEIVYQFAYEVGDLLRSSATKSTSCVLKQGSYKTELWVDGYILYITESPLWGSFWTTVSNIMLGLIVNLSLIWRFIFVSRKMYYLTSVPIIKTLLLMWTISIILSIGPMGCLFSRRCWANLDFLFPYLKSRKFSRKRTLKGLTLCPIHFMLQEGHVSW
jgi:hypothetical protein